MRLPIVTVAVADAGSKGAGAPQPAGEGAEALVLLRGGVCNSWGITFGPPALAACLMRPQHRTPGAARRKEHTRERMRALRFPSLERREEGRGGWSIDLWCRSQLRSLHPVAPP